MYRLHQWSGQLKWSEKSTLTRDESVWEWFWLLGSSTVASRGKQEAIEIEKSEKFRSSAVLRRQEDRYKTKRWLLLTVAAAPTPAINAAIASWTSTAKRSRIIHEISPSIIDRSRAYSTRILVLVLRIHGTATPKEPAKGDGMRCRHECRDFPFLYNVLC